MLTPPRDKPSGGRHFDDAEADAVRGVRDDVEEDVAAALGGRVLREGLEELRLGLIRVAGRCNPPGRPPRQKLTIRLQSAVSFRWIPYSASAAGAPRPRQM